MKFFKHIKVLPSEACVTQHMPTICDFKTRKSKDTRRKIVLSRKIMEITSTSSGQVVKKILLLLDCLERRFTRSCKKKLWVIKGPARHGGRMMMLVIVLGNYGRGGNSETKVRRSF